MAVRRSRPRRTTLRVRVARSGMAHAPEPPNAVRRARSGRARRSAPHRWPRPSRHRRRNARLPAKRTEPVDGEPWQIMGQHAQQDERHPRRGPMEHRTQLEIDGLQRAEGVLDAAETFEARTVAAASETRRVIKQPAARSAGANTQQRLARVVLTDIRSTAPISRYCPPQCQCAAQHLPSTSKQRRKPTLSRSCRSSAGLLTLIKAQPVL